MELSTRARRVKESSTLALTVRAKELKASGADIVSFTAGEPDFGTPEHVCAAAVSAINAGFTKYTAASGIPELKKAVCDKLLKDNGLTYTPGQIVITNGAKQAVYNAFQAILNEGDEVLTPAPYWISYVEIVAMCGGVWVPVYGAEDNGLKVTVEQLERAVTPRTKAVIINSPNNPTGAVYSREELKAIADFAVAHDLFVVSDEIYEKLIFDEGLGHVSIASLGDEIYKRTVVINGFSKSYSMTGWRVGYSASSADMAAVMGNIQSHATSNANSIAQKAALAAITGDQSCVEDMRAAFGRRRDYICSRLGSMPGIKAVMPPGAFYVFANVEELCNAEIGGARIDDSTGLAEALLQECGVAVVAGADFGYEKYLRFSYSMREQEIAKGMDRIEAFIKKHYLF